MNFEYTREQGGLRMSMQLPFDPIAAGFRIMSHAPCCIKFTDGEFVLDVKTATQIIFIAHKDDLSRILTEKGCCPRSHESFINKVEKAKELWTLA